MKFWRRPKIRLTSLNLPVVGGGVTWEDTSDERKVRARTERAAAFTELWTIAQGAHIGVRNNFDNVDTLAEVHRQLNVLLIQKAPALDPGDVALAQKFLDALEAFIRLLQPETGEAAENVREAMEATEAPYFPAELEELSAAYDLVSQHNESLKRRYRTVVFGEDE